MPEIISKNSVENSGPLSVNEVRGQRWGRENPIEYKVWLAEEISLSDPPPKRAIPERLNPVFKGNLEHYTKDDLDAWRDLIHNHVLNSELSGTEPLTLLWINDRAELERVFPSFPFGRNSDGDKITKLSPKSACTPRSVSAMILEAKAMPGSYDWFPRTPGKRPGKR